jgi:hypothetical protein
LNQSAVFGLLGPSGLEDSFAAYLFDKYGYWPLPSTNKISTPGYEFVMLDKLDGGTIGLQAKNGKTRIPIETYEKDIQDGAYKETWLVTTGGTVTRNGKPILSDGRKVQIARLFRADNILRIEYSDLTEFQNWVLSKDNQNYLSPIVRNYVSWCSSDKQEPK